MDQVKVALMKLGPASQRGSTTEVRNKSSSLPSSRRCSVAEDTPPDINNDSNAFWKQSSKAPTQQRRRQTVMGMPAGLADFLASRGDESKAQTNDYSERESNDASNNPDSSQRQTIVGLSVPMFFGDEGDKSKACSGDINTTSSDNYHLKQSTLSDLPPVLDKPTKKGRPRRRLTVESMLPPFFADLKAEKSTAEEGINIWESGLESTKRDEREAIWINRKDGCVDIQKECRKLYSQESRKDLAPPRRPRRRATLMGELDIPKGLQRG